MSSQKKQSNRVAAASEILEAIPARLVVDIAEFHMHIVYHEGEGLDVSATPEGVARKLDGVE